MPPVPKCHAGVCLKVPRKCDGRHVECGCKLLQGCVPEAFGENHFRRAPQTGFCRQCKISRRDRCFLHKLKNQCRHEAVGFGTEVFKKQCSHQLPDERRNGEGTQHTHALRRFCKVERTHRGFRQKMNRVRRSRRNPKCLVGRDDAAHRTAFYKHHAPHCVKKLRVRVSVFRTLLSEHEVTGKPAPSFCCFFC